MRSGTWDVMSIDVSEIKAVKEMHIYRPFQWAVYLDVSFRINKHIPVKKQILQNVQLYQKSIANKLKLHKMNV